MNRLVRLFRSVSKDDLTSAAPEEDALPQGAELPSLPTVIAQLGFGRAQLQVMFTGGALWLADAAELMIISSASEAVQTEFRLGPLQRSSFMTIVFAGVFLGNFMGGFFGDAYGRRVPIITSFIGIFYWSIVSAFSWSYLSLAAFRFCVGVSIGLGQPAETALIAEVTPKNRRILSMSMTYILFAIGEALAAILIWLDDKDMLNLHWRNLVAASAAPGLVFGFATVLFSYESPYYLVFTGKYEAAVKVLENMRAANGLRKGDVAVQFKLPEVETTHAWTQLRTVFSREMLPITLTMCFSIFLLNITLFGSLYAFSEILVTQKDSAEQRLSAAAHQIIGACWEVPGYVIGAVLGSFAPRRQAAYIYLVLTCLCLLWVSFATVGTVAFQVGYYGVKIWPCLGYIILYLFSAEVYPTDARVTGVAVCFSFGRFGAMVAAPAFEVMKFYLGDYRPYMWCVAFLLVLNGIGLKCMPEPPTCDVDEATCNNYGSVNSMRGREPDGR